MKAQALKLEVPRDDAGARLDRFLSRELALSIEIVRALICGGRVRIRGRGCAVSRRLFGGEEVEVTRPSPRPEPGGGPALPVLYDDEDCLVVSKPAGLAVEPARPRGLSVVGAASRLGRFDVAGRALPGLAHRLDKDTSGCLLLARHDRALAALRRGFEAGEVEKLYLVLVVGVPDGEGELDTPYARDPGHPRRFTTRMASPRRARLAYRVRERLGGASLLEVHLLTGRTHQIRVQLAEAGFPVVGDALYGTASDAIARQALHAAKLSFIAPCGRRVSVAAPLPLDFAAARERLRGPPSQEP
jgi:23S rRNA pseudouridine1911/1915/1917 synthase